MECAGWPLNWQNTAPQISLPIIGVSLSEPHTSKAMLLEALAVVDTCVMHSAAAL